MQAFLNLASYEVTHLYNQLYYSLALFNKQPPDRIARPAVTAQPNRSAYKRRSPGSSICKFACQRFTASWHLKVTGT